jgi:acid phosphatase
MTHHAHRWHARLGLWVVFGMLASLALGPATAAAAGPLFSDGFESGDFSAWSLVKTGGDGSATVQSTTVHDGADAARLSATTNASSYAYARQTLASAQTDVTVDGWFMVQQEGAANANVPLLRLYDSNGARQLSVYRQNLAGSQLWVQWGGSYIKTSGTLPLNAWAELTVHAVPQGAGASTLDVSLNGAAIYHTTTANLGADVKTLQIGNDTQRQAFTLIADSLSVTGPAGDTTPPDTTITGGPSGTVNTGSASFTFTATEPATFTCQLDSGAPAACTSPQSYSNLADGAHSFSVFATDTAGNTDATPATRTWTVSSALFSDGFESGNLSAWTTVKTGADGSATVQSTTAHDGTYAARFSETTAANSVAYARKTFASPQTDLNVDGWFMVQQDGAAGSSVPLLRLFDGSGVRQLNLYRLNGSANQVWAQWGGSYIKTSGTLPLNTWADVRVHAVTAGAQAGLLDIWLNGAQIYHTTSANLGSGIATLQLGNEAQRQTFTLLADSISVTAGGGVTLGSVPNFDHVYWIVFENEEASSIVGSSDAPYFNQLISQGGLATNFTAETHPSQPNYIAMFSGSTQGVTDDSVHDLSGQNVADQIEAAGKTWMTFAENYPGGCYTGASASGGADGDGTYVRRHVPAMSFTNITQSSTRCANVTDFSHFDPAAADFEMIVPNLCHDMHDCSVATGDSWLQNWLATNILNTATWQNTDSAIFITFDEGTTNVGGGGVIPTIVLSKHTAAGFTSNIAHNHYSLLRTLQDAWGLGCLNESCAANNMSEFFNSGP